MLTPKGRLYGELRSPASPTIQLHAVGSGAAQEMHRRWFEQHLPEEGVTYRNVCDQLHGIAIAGPRSRELLSRSRVTTCRPMRSSSGPSAARRGGVPVILVRVSFSGELGYEIYCAPQFQLRSTKP